MNEVYPKDSINLLKYGNYRNTNNTPICNGRTVLRFKTLNENNIKDENVVQLIKME